MHVCVHTHIYTHKYKHMYIYICVYTYYNRAKSIARYTHTNTPVILIYTFSANERRLQKS